MCLITVEDYLTFVMWRPYVCTHSDNVILFDSVSSSVRWSQLSFGMNAMGFKLKCFIFNHVHHFGSKIDDFYRFVTKRTPNYNMKKRCGNPCSDLIPGIVRLQSVAGAWSSSQSHLQINRGSSHQHQHTDGPCLKYTDSDRQAGRQTDRQTDR